MKKLPRTISTDYIKNNKPKIINWKVIAGPPLSTLQMYDVVYDNHDLKIRRIDKF